MTFKFLPCSWWYCAVDAFCTYCGVTFVKSFFFFINNPLLKIFFKNHVQLCLPSDRTWVKISFHAKNQKWPKCHIPQYFTNEQQYYAWHFYFRMWVVDGLVYNRLQVARHLSSCYSSLSFGPKVGREKALSRESKITITKESWVQGVIKLFFPQERDFSQ